MRTNQTAAMIIARDTEISTCFAPAKRASHLPIMRDVLYLANDPELQNLLNSLSVGTAILNKERQIVFANEKLQEMASSTGTIDVLEMRPGEALNCKNSNTEPGGCGTSEHCRYCGAVRVILQSQNFNTRVSEDCRMTIKVNNCEISADFHVTAAPLNWRNRDYTMLSLLDIGHEKRRRAMERIFFHDLTNKTWNLKGLMDLVENKMIQPTDAFFLEATRTITDDLADELLFYRMLTDAENQDLRVVKAPVLSDEIIRKVTSLFVYYEVAKDIQIQVSADSASCLIYTEPTLLTRILTNMLKNALEASVAGEVVRIGCIEMGNGISFWVHNQAVMSRDVIMQVFQRSFSTKGNNRGLGTYSIKLLGEDYLKGKVKFTSSQGEGTVFSIMLPLGID